MKWKIGNVQIDNQVVLAPMAGVCNSTFRQIIKSMGCGLIYAEMVSDKAVSYGNKKTIDMLYMNEMERPIVQQIFGNDEDTFVKSAKFIYQTMKPDIIDINMGCPVPKVAVRSQAGSALLKDPAKVKNIVKSVVESVPIPVTVKIRSGWDNKSINAVEIAKICEDAGASAICVHPRTRSQNYTGLSDWSIIKDVKDNVKIPVIGNGDIMTCYDAKRMLLETGCDAVMIGRGCLGNPWLIKETIDYLANGTVIAPPTDKDKIEMCKYHLDKLIELKGEKVALTEIRSHAGWYFKCINGGKKLKYEVNTCKNIESLNLLLIKYINMV